MSWLVNNDIIDLLNEKFVKYNQKDFIENDPISVPHGFTKKQDIEIAAFFAAILAWGQRKTIINKCNELMARMDNSPYDFVKNAKDSDLKILEGFKHRTFNDFDLLFTIEFFKKHYSKHQSLEQAFLIVQDVDQSVKNNLTEFKKYFFEGNKVRTEKHIPTPLNKSACKRLNMFLRWMVRKDEVDFGIWSQIHTSQLIIPCDVHVENVAKRLNLTSKPKADWSMAEEITINLKSLDEVDPVKYDFALFGMGVEKYFGSLDSKKNR